MDIIRQGAKLDWISPVIDLCHVITGHGGTLFSVAPGPYTASEAVHLLHEQGIDTYSHCYDAWADQYHFRVDPGFAEDARRILVQNGVIVL